MNRIEFMKQLESLLWGISKGERDEALQYYNDYFDDAGAENEKDVIGALGTPAKVAETIKSGLTGKVNENCEFTESGFKAQNAGRGNELSIPYNREENRNGNPYAEKTVKKNMNPVAVIFIILGVIFLSPVWLGLGGVAFGLIVAVLAVVFSLFLVVALLGAAFGIVGITLFIVGLIKIVVAPLASLVLIGTGLIFGALGILFLVATIWLCATAIPAMIRGIVYICRLPFRGRREQAA